MARFMALALANKEIAAQLAITKRTVESLVEHIRIRLGLYSRSQMAAWVTQSEIGTESR